MGQNTSNSVWKPCEDLQKTFDLCHCQQSVYNKVLRWNFVIDQILIFHHNLQIISLKILQCYLLDFFSYFVSHSWGIPMMKITGLSHLFKCENLHNWWLTKYFFAPLYICNHALNWNFKKNRYFSTLTLHCWFAQKSRISLTRGNITKTHAIDIHTLLDRVCDQHLSPLVTKQPASDDV